MYSDTGSVHSSYCWQGFEETALLEHLTNNISTTTDSLTFPNHVWKSASEHVNSRPTPSGSKTRSEKPASSCKDKWVALNAAYDQIQFIKSTSRHPISWSDADDEGVLPLPETQSVPRTLSAIVQAQQEGSAVMSKLTDLVGDLSKSFAETSHMVPFAQHSPNTNFTSHLAQAVEIVCNSPGLSEKQIIDMVDFFSHPENEASAVAYAAINHAQFRCMWALRRLEELRAKSK
ncbi:hypothetical protein CY34DRAFT_812574 [Suillus luteus UH-Slu-Lm8-n1]|uniref:Uncharacterized protein n=1 Tax=Suillus luteus UH-Slu-Lm8-n1 TaxID=930992 RepID=A0A0D0AKU7_9AGAM|nr:hypothetical protein CY34DRAFT_812574 [Suillus luteus UH-Slu-Lm8-n1]